MMERSGMTSQDILTDAAFENAMAVHAACGGSTNLLLHMPAIAHAAGRRRMTVDDWNRVNLNVPRLVDVLPNGPVGHPTTQLYAAGGVPEVMLNLKKLGLLNLDVLTVTGKTLRENLEWWEESDRRKYVRTFLSENDKIHTTKINNLARQSDSLTRDLRDLVENEVKLQHILSAFGFDKNMETFDVETLVQGLNSELTSLSALNAKAPETYLEVSYGYRSMSTRKNSLEEERNSIVKFIEDIERDKRQTFLDAFDKVDKEIRLIFNKMTGGHAWLELQNEDDIFNSGISYLIQFPNKPKRESTSISGGEKTLAAIVFVLALQKLKPSPFYLFDEVDAHLDAPNAERLSNILEERSKESQFIMVSLKDSVIQKAKLIYGVFPKNGVSHVVTYKDKRMPSVKSS